MKIKMSLRLVLAKLKRAGISGSILDFNVSLGVRRATQAVEFQPSSEILHEEQCRFTSPPSRKPGTDKWNGAERWKRGWKRLLCPCRWESFVASHVIWKPR
jgi:hypothetical protein